MTTDIPVELSVRTQNLLRVGFRANIQRIRIQAHLLFHLEGGSGCHYDSRPDFLRGRRWAAIQAVRAKPDKWETDSGFDGSVQTILGMMDMVWKGHLRHGDEDAPLEVSQKAADMTVQTAVLLVGWFRSGRIRLKP